MNKDGLRGLVAVVELGSFVAASRRLGLPRPTLRRRLDELESEVGVPLLVRTGSGTVPTEAGRMLAQRGVYLLRDEAAVLSAVRDIGSEASGELELVIPDGTAPPIVATLLRAMRDAHPKVALSIQTASDPIAALQAGVDAALAFGDRQPGGRWVSMEIVRIRRHMVASRDYLDERGVPETPEDLHEHDLMAWRPPSGDARSWPLTAGGTVDVNLKLTSPDVHMVRQVAAHGLGITLAPDAGLAEAGLPLVPVMPELIGESLAVRLIVPTALEGLARIKALVSTVRSLAAAHTGLSFGADPEAPTAS